MNKPLEFLNNEITVKKLIKELLSVNFYPFKYLIPKGKIIVFSGLTNYTYSGNSRYLFECLSKDKSLTVYWFTNSKIIKKYLEKFNLKHISYASPLKLIWVLLRAKIIFNDGDDYLNLFRLSDNTGTFKISLFHGYGPKTTLAKSQNPLTLKNRINRLNKFHYINFPSPFLAKEVASQIFSLPLNKIKILGSPKNDFFFNKKFVEDAYNQKLLTKSIFGNIKNKSKLILYTPTWRPYNFNLPLLDMKSFNAPSFNEFLELHNLYFVYTVHSTWEPDNLLQNFDRIKFIDTNVNNLYDTNQMMLETDILLNDYSTTSTDFSILSRPQIFFMPDYESYTMKKGFLEDYRSTMPGSEVEDYHSFVNLLSNIMKNPTPYINKYQKKREVLLDKYYNLSNSKSVDNYKEFIKEIIK